MKRFLFLLCFSMLLAGGIVRAQQTAPSSMATQHVRFETVDVKIDPHGKPLAAYQIEFIADPNRVTLVGIEGGEHPAYKIPPYYDPKALAGNRVILAALSTNADLPTKNTRIAKLHLRIAGEGKPAMTAQLIVAAAANEQIIPASVEVLEGVKP